MNSLSNTGRTGSMADTPVGPSAHTPAHTSTHTAVHTAAPPWPTQLADALLGWALEAQPDLAPPLQAALHRCVAQLETDRGAGHVGLPLTATDAAKLRASGLVEDNPAQPEGRPLVIHAQVLYLHRDFDHEQALARRINALRAVAPTPIHTEPLRSLFPLAFDGAAEGVTKREPDWQAVAVAQALRQRLTVISGGPGTGKTSTVVKLLACVLAATPQARIALAAPTGKAAQRLLDALREGAARLDLHGLALPSEAFTVHRLLGATPKGLRHGVGTPLALDWLVVDEASMLDLALARQLFDALGPNTRLVLLGDRHQLAAVENGAVFAALSHEPCWSVSCSHALGAALDRPLALPALVGHAGALPDLAVQFTRSHRFAATSGIGQLSALLREGHAVAALDLLHQGAADLHWRPTASAAELDALIAHELAGYAAALARLAQAPDDAMHLDAVWHAWDAFRVLCAGHGGAWGTRAMNALCAQNLRRALPPHAPPDMGRALLVTRNQGRFVNGDILLLLPSASGALAACLRRGTDTLFFEPEQLPTDLDGAFALTVHKAQGSEFDRALLLLPSLARPPSREWLYTGATRARHALGLIGSAEAVRDAINRPAERRSGLRSALTAAPSD